MTRADVLRLSIGLRRGQITRETLSLEAIDAVQEYWVTQYLRRLPRRRSSTPNAVDCAARRRLHREWTELHRLTSGDTVDAR